MCGGEEVFERGKKRRGKRLKYKWDTTNTPRPIPLRCDGNVHETINGKGMCRISTASV
jgi:hypothetical protein